MRSAAIAVILVLAGCHARRPRSPADLKSELEAMLETDQAGRGGIEETQKKFGQDSKEMRDLWAKQRAVDRKNLARLEEILKVHGWPGRSLVGEEAASAAFLILQHADLPYQEKYFEIAKNAAEAGELRRASFALLEDRILVRKGKKQLYGSQLSTGKTGVLAFDPIEDEANVDKRRASVGLQPLADYAKFFGLEYPPK